MIVTGSLFEVVTLKK